MRQAEPAQGALPASDYRRSAIQSGLRANGAPSCGLRSFDRVLHSARLTLYALIPTHTPHRKKRCAICGVNLATTSDHVPPKACFAKPFPKIMVTVPSCAPCNNGAAVLDERFAVYLGMQVGDNGDAAIRLWKDRNLRSLAKNPRLMREIADSMRKLDPTAFDDGQLPRRLPFEWPRENYDAVMERMARGYYYRQYRSILGSGANCEVTMLLETGPGLRDLLPGVSEFTIADGALRCSYGRAEESPLRSIWYFELYGRQRGIVETYPADEAPSR